MTTHELLSILNKISLFCYTICVAIIIKNDIKDIKRSKKRR